MNKILYLALILLALPMAGAQAYVSPETSPAQIRLLSEKQVLGTGDPEALLGLDLQMESGWHTYWSSPGEAGAPPEIRWTGSSNLESATLLFPAPRRIETPLSDTIGYETDVLLPIKAVRTDPSKPLELQAKVTVYLCKQLCLPHTQTFALSLPSGTAEESADAPLLQKAVAQIPKATEAHGLKIIASKRSAEGLYLTVGSKTPFESPDLFIESDSDVLFGRPVFTFTENGTEADVFLPVQYPLPEGKDMSTLRLTATLVDGPRTLAERLPNQDAQPPAPALWLMLVLALLGGFVLNLMPCVLPVLSLKILAVIKHKTSDPQMIRRSFLATAAGIVLSFLALAVLTLGLKYAGFIVGWGLQFQQPLFLVFMVIVLTAFATNLWGFWTLSPPRRLMDILSAPQHPKLAGDFGTGFLATLLATPCTAPFLGTAVGFALAAGGREIVAIFFMLGVGMALPYLLIALHPRLSSFLPKPGKWMEPLSALLGLGLAGTALWLLFVLESQIGAFMACIIGAGAIGIGLVLYLAKRGVPNRFVLALFAVISIGMATAAASADLLAPPDRRAQDWQVFSEDKLEAAIKNDQIVFVDITAEWCLNCKFNKRFILSQRKVVDRLFGRDDILLLQGDWTTSNPVLTEFMQKHGRYGIPFNAVFGPKAPNGILLPEILSPSAIFTALDQAR